MIRPPYTIDATTSIRVFATPVTDGAWEQKVKAYKACKEAGVRIPDELAEYFGSRDLVADNEFRRIEIQSHGYTATHVRTGGDISKINVIEIRVASLPFDVDSIDIEVTNTRG